MFIKLKGNGRRTPIDAERILKMMEHALKEEKIYLKNDVTMEMVARCAGTNRTYVAQALRYAGSGFYDYLNSFRVRYLEENASVFAKERCTMEEVAERCGFATARTLNSYLKKTCGMTATAFIRQKCKNPAKD